MAMPTSRAYLLALSHVTFVLLLLLVLAALSKPDIEVYKAASRDRITEILVKSGPSETDKRVASLLLGPTIGGALGALSEASIKDCVEKNLNSTYVWDMTFFTVFVTPLGCGKSHGMWLSIGAFGMVWG